LAPKIDRDKTLPKGDEKLFKRNEWISSEQMDCETKVLNLPLLHEAFDRVVNSHLPIQYTAFLSLCTATRPYYHSKKWSQYLYHFKGKVDMIVVSNGGFVPEHFWESWPFLNYEAGPHEDDTLYKKVMYDRMHKFFKAHDYKYVIANFNPRQRNYEPAEQSLRELKQEGHIEDYVLTPSAELYKEAQEDGFRGPNGAGDMFPDLHKVILNNIINEVEKFGYDKTKLPQTIFDL
jgi:hypothetical protein